MKKRICVIVSFCLVFGIFLASCSSDSVEKGVYDAVVSERDNALVELSNITTERDALIAKTQELEEEISSLREDIESEKAKTSDLENKLSEKEKELEKLKSSSDVAELAYVEFMAEKLSSDAVSFEIKQEERSVVVKFLFGMSIDNFVSTRDFLKAEHESLVNDFAALIKDMSDSFTGWTVVGIIHTNDGVPLEVIVNGDVVKY